MSQVTSKVEEKQELELQNTFIQERVSYLLPLLEKLSHSTKQKDRKLGFKLGDEKLTGWKQLAVDEATLLKQVYPDNKADDEKTYSTIVKRQIPALKKALRIATKTDLLDAANFNPVNTIINHFGEHLSDLFAEYLNRINEKQREDRKERSKAENRIEIDLTDYLQRANEYLVKAFNGHDSSIWLDVSCSLALSTGRRMSEVHQSAEFTKVDDYTIKFKGQLKGKGRKLDGKALINAEFEIPTLIKADLVITALQWLEKHSKRIDKDADTELVNRRYSKTLNLKAKEWDIMPDGMTYHKFRACYLIANIARENIHNYDYLRYASSILGDDDASTILAYQRFNLKPESLNRI